MSADHDIVIVGAGCAGLSVAVHLLETGIGDRRVTLLEPRTEYVRDRTWCAFRVMRHPFERAVTHRWAQWNVRAHGHVVTRGSVRHPYEHIPADAFYRAARERIETSDRVELALGTHVTAIDDRGDRVRVVTDRGDIDARFVLDSRPEAARPQRREGDVRLLQSFVGWRIRTEDPSFDPEVCTLMDFDVDASGGGVHFVYVLPFSEHDALVEDTFFSEAAVDAGVHEESLARWLERRGIEDYEVIERERGVLPMSTERYEPAVSPRVVRIGIAGGLARPATGYAFLAIQRHARVLARALARETAPRPPDVRAARTLFLDRVFLSYLARHPERAPELFARMFERVPADTLARFLSEASQLRDDLQVMSALPALPFAAEALRARRIWLRR